MSALTKSVSRPVRPPVGGIKTRALPMIGATNYGAAYTIYKGSIVVCDVTSADGYFEAPTTNDAQAADVIGGVAVEQQSIAAAQTSDGLKKVTVAVDGVWAFPKASLSITDIGAPVYATTDNDLTSTSTTAWWIGVIVDVDGTYVWVDIAQACGQLNLFPT